jgi:hypothetical protein
MQEERIKYKEREQSSEDRINVNIASKRLSRNIRVSVSSENIFLLLYQRIREIRYEISGNFRRNLLGEREKLVDLFDSF